eukprot:CAMPEP_0119128862 /NCGR_PEP_ID=MMETSP1310-20130426/6843_1 /TAXON_ID=464262 /ORGANISM="Genus nov. species nov., Strain RCC2339" /LENGTH=91 /DNA_ID=CAMNT_0007119235 /DNA_START=210 /DNA_END=482 /DNA_ORIENTATION=-
MKTSLFVLVWWSLVMAPLVRGGMDFVVEHVGHRCDSSVSGFTLDILWKWSSRSPRTVSGDFAGEEEFWDERPPTHYDQIVGVDFDRDGRLW